MRGKRRVVKRICVVLMAFIMAVAFMPAMAFADTTITGICGFNSDITYTYDIATKTLRFAKIEGTDGSCTINDSTDWSTIAAKVGDYTVENLELDRNIQDISYGYSCSINFLSNLKTILVDEENSYLSCDNNVLIKNYYEDGVLKRGILLYPSANERTEYTVPTYVDVIFSYAIKNPKHLDKIKVTHTIEKIGSIEGIRLKMEFSEDAGLPEFYDTSWCRLLFKMPCDKYSTDFLSGFVNEYSFDGDVFLEHDFSEDGVCNKCGATLTSAEFCENYEFDVKKYPIDKLKDQYYLFNKDTQTLWGVEYYDIPIRDINVPETLDGVPVTEFRFPNDVQWDEFMSEVENISISPNVTKVSLCFGDTKVKEIKIPDSVTDIYVQAMEDSMLEKISYPISVDARIHVGNGSGLTHFVFTKGTGGGIDYDSVSHKNTPWYINRNGDISIELGDGIRYIGSYMFANIPSIEEYQIPASVTEIGDNAFYRNDDLVDVVLQEGLRELGYQTFAENKKLTNVTLPESLTDIKYNTFDGCPNLVLTVAANSYAQKYAEKYGIKYRVGENGTVVNPPSPSGGTGGSGSAGGSAAGGGGAALPPSDANKDVQTPSICTGNGAFITMSKDGTTASISVTEGYTVIDVILNGTSLGAVSEVKDLKTGDRLAVLTESESDAIVREWREVRTHIPQLKSTASKGVIKLSFGNGSNISFDGYEIYRSAGDKKHFKKYASTKKNTYSNAKYLKKGTRYYYKVRGYKMVDGEKVYTKWSRIVYRVAR